MYKMFENMRNTVRTETNSRIFLDDPKKKDGKFTNYVSYINHGTMDVITQPQVLMSVEGSELLWILPWYIENMRGEGSARTGNIDGPIKVVGDPGVMSTGVIRQNAAGVTFPATLEASVFQVSDIPGYGILRNRARVTITAIVDELPPFDALCKCDAALLYDEQNNIRGIVDGRALTILPT